MIGASTGGPGALGAILSVLPRDFPAGVIAVQHVDSQFVSGFASWLDEKSLLSVRTARTGDRPIPGVVLIANTSDHLVLDRKGQVTYVSEPCDYPYRPSVNVSFRSAAEAWSKPGVAVLLTGMGRDGARGLLELKSRGWHTIAQDRESSTVYGMPRAAAELGAAEEILPLADIADGIHRALMRPCTRIPHRRTST
jgi:chemotaxis response regulator CheB